MNNTKTDQYSVQVTLSIMRVVLVLACLLAVAVAEVNLIVLLITNSKYFILYLKENWNCHNVFLWTFPPRKLDAFYEKWCKIRFLIKEIRICNFSNLSNLYQLQTLNWIKILIFDFFHNLYVSWVVNKKI